MKPRGEEHVMWVGPAGEDPNTGLRCDCVTEFDRPEERYPEYENGSLVDPEAYILSCV